MKSSFCIDLQRFMLIPTKFPLTHSHCYIKLGASYVFGFGKHVKQNNEASQQRGAGSAILE